MIKTNTIIVLTFILQLFIVIFIAFFKPYLKAKGENWATKQDIKNITINIEEVKHQYAQFIEKDKAKYNLTFQSLQLLLSQRDNIAFQLYEDSSRLFNKFRYIKFDYHNNRIEGDENQLHNLCDELITKKSKLSVLFNEEKNILQNADDLQNVVLTAACEFSKLNSQIYAKQSELIKNKVYIEAYGRKEVLDIEKMNEYQNEINNLISEYRRFVYSLTRDFDDKRKSYLYEVQIYYDGLKNKLSY